MLLIALLVACGSPEPAEETPAPETEETGVVDSGAPDTASDPTGTSDTSSTDTAVDTAAPWDCAALPSPPLPTSMVPDVHPSEDFAFDDQGNLISHRSGFMWKQPYPPAAGAPWAPTTGNDSGVASIRMLPTGDLVYHDVNTSSLYRIAPDGSESLVYTGFAYAGGIEVHPTSGWIYVADLLGIHRIEPYTQQAELHGDQGAWSGPNGVTLSSDWLTLYVGTYEGIFALPLDADGVPTGPPALWAPPPPNAGELLGMGVDACGNVYVVGKVYQQGQTVGTLWRYPIAGGPPEVLLQAPGGWLSNLQWGSGIGGWDATHLFVVDQYGTGAANYHEIELGVGEKPR